MKTYFKIFALILLPIFATAQVPTATGNTKIRVFEGNNAWIASLNDLISGRVGPDSTWVKYNGAYVGKRVIDNVYRFGTTSLRSTDTSGILNIYAQAHPKPAIYTRYTDAGSGFLFFQLDPDGQTSNSSVGNFNFWGTNFTGVNSPYSTRANHVWRFGYNTGGGGSRVISTDADLHIAFESNYYRTTAGGAVKRIWEWHLQSEDTLGVVHRPLSLGGAHNGTAADFGIAVDLISFANYAGTAKGWMSFKYGQYLKGLTFQDTATLQFALPQPSVDMIRARNAGNTADLSILQLDGSNRVVFPRSSIDLYSYASKLTFNTAGTITTADANPIQIGDATNKSFVSIYAPSTEVLRLRSNTGGSDLWQTYVNADNIVWARPDGQAYLQAYDASAPQIILANSRMGIGVSPANTLDVNGTARIRTMTGTATTIAGLNGSNEISSITVGSGLSLSANTLTATGGGVGGSGAANQVAYWNGTTTITGSANYLFDGTSKLSLLASSAATTTDPSINYQITGGSSWITGIDNSDNDRFKISLRNALGTNDRFWMDTTGKAFFHHTGVFNSQNSNVATIGSVPGSENYPGIWFGSGAPSLSNYAFLADVAANKTILNAPSTGYVSVGVNNSEVVRVKSPGISIATGANPINALDVEGGAVIGASYAGTNTAPTNGLQVQGITMVGTSSSAGQFNVDGSGSTSSTYSGVFRNSSSQVVLAARDDQRVGVNTSAPNRALEVSGEVRITDLDTDTGTKIVLADADGDLDAVTPSSEFALTGSAISLAQQGATTGQVLEWNGTSWAPATDDTGGGGGDHGALTGLGDDDHTQYLLLDGRAGGQVATGGTASGDDITLRSTSNATKGDIILADQGGNVILGGGTTAGEWRFYEPSVSGTNYTAFTTAAQTANQTYTWPTDAPGNGESLKWTTGGQLAWEPNYYQTVADGTSDATQRARLRFVGNSEIGVALTDDVPNQETEVSFNIPTDAIGELEIAAGSVGTSEVTTNSLLAEDFAVNVVSSIDGVTNDGGDVDFVAGENVTITPSDGSDNVTFAALSGSISPSQITSDQDNYNPTNWSSNTTAKISANDIRAITSFAALPDGTVRRLINTGTKAIYIPGNHPDGTAGNLVAGSSDQILAPNSGVIEMYYDGGSSIWRILRNTFNAADIMASGLVGHYYNISVGATTGADWGNIGFGLASGANGTANPTSALPGGWDINTSTSAAGVATLYLSKTVVNPVEIGSAHIVTSCAVYVPTLSDGTQTYTLQFGIIPTPTSTTLNVNNSVGIRYSNGTNSGKWQGFSRDNAGAESTADLGVTVAASTNYVLTVAYDKARTEARFYVNGAFAGRVTGNMPNATDAGVRVAIVKSAGTTSRSAVVPSLTFYTVY